MLAPVTHIHPLTKIRRKRLLPVSGRVHVRKGQKVSSTDVIADSELSPEYLLLDIGKGLGVSRKKADQYLQCKPGDEVISGDIIAGPVGIMKRVMRSPRNGRLMFAENGKVYIKLSSNLYKLKAGLPGIIIELIDEQGVIIETKGALIQGVWGNGKIDSGMLKTHSQEADDILSVGSIDVSLRGSIVVAGSCKDKEVLQEADELPLRGLILASMHSTLIPQALRVSFPIILIEGFGQMPMNSVAFRLLSTNENREVTVNAEPLDRFAGSRPEVIIPLTTDSDLPMLKTVSIFAPGERVRVLRYPNIGKIGTLENISQELVTLPNGISALVGEVRLENDRSVLVPLDNLEIVI